MMRLSLLHLKIGLLFCVFLGCTTAQAQMSLQEREVLQLVKKYHPVSRQAALLPAWASAYQLKAAAGFDLKLEGAFQAKEFDGKQYYQIGEAALKWPLWFGADLKAGYQYTGGQFLDPSDELPTAGQAILGFEMPLIQGLFFDQRRRDVQQARLLKEQNEWTQRLMLNDLLFETGIAYWEWAYTATSMRILDDAAALARVRLEATKQSWVQGDRAAIDTTEAFAQWQLRRNDWLDARRNERQNGLQLSQYLWYEDDKPVLLGENVQAERLDTFNVLGAAIRSLTIAENIRVLDHPAVRTGQLKINSLQIEQRWAREIIKPDLRLNYNILGDGVDFNPNSDAILPGITNNYKWGLTLEMPLLLRKGRAERALADLTLKEANLDLVDKIQGVASKNGAYESELRLAMDQLTQYEALVQNYQKLLDAEIINFQLGESNLFLVNTRENSLVQAKLKLAKIQCDIAKLRLGVQWAKGNLWTLDF